MSIDQEQQLYVIPNDYDGYSCLGFDVALQRAIAYAKWAGVAAPDPSLRGTDEGYADYERCLKAVEQKWRETGERCPVELTPQLIGLEGKRVEVVDRDGEERRFYVGKSTGFTPCHLEILKRGDDGGFSVTGAPFRSVRRL